MVDRSGEPEKSIKAVKSFQIVSSYHKQELGRRLGLSSLVSLGLVSSGQRPSSKHEGHTEVFPRRYSPSGTR